MDALTRFVASATRVAAVAGACEKVSDSAATAAPPRGASELIVPPAPAADTAAALTLTQSIERHARRNDSRLGDRLLGLQRLRRAAELLSSIGGNPIFSHQLTRDEIGRIAHNVESLFGSSITFDYGYDTSGRLTEVKQNGAVIVSAIVKK